MKKTINKMVKLFSLGLLLYAVSIPYAYALNLVTPKDAWEFMEDNSADKGKGFRGDYSKSDFKSTKVACGKRVCDISNRVCLSKTNERGKPDYVCAAKTNVSKFISLGYRVIAGDYNENIHNNVLLTSAEIMLKSQVNQVKEQVDWASENIIGNCYEAGELKAGSATRQAEVYCVRSTGDQVTILAGENRFGMCEVIEVAWYNSRNCLFCPLLGVVYAVADKIAITSQKAFAKSLAIVTVVGLMVWIAFKVLVFVSDVTKQDIAKFITELLTQSFKFLIVFYLLIYYGEIFDRLILPLIRAGMEFGLNFVETTSLEDRFGGETLGKIMQASKAKQSTLIAGIDKVPVDYIRNADNEFFDLYTYATMENLAYNVNAKYALLQTLGRGLICVGSGFILGIFRNDADFGLGFACVIYGFCWGLFGFLLSLAFIFYLLDSIVQIGFIGGLLPFLIISWPFKLTAKYTKTGFNVLMNSIFIFMMMGVVVNIGMELINLAVEYNSHGDALDEEINAFTQLGQAISTIDSVKLGKMVNIFSIGFLLFIISNLLAMMFMKKATDFAEKFSESGFGLKIASEGATAAGKTIKAYAKKTAMIGSDAAGKIKTVVAGSSGPAAGAGSSASITRDQANKGSK